MKHFFSVFLVVVLNLLFPTGWFNLPYFIAVLVLVAFSFNRSVWFVLALLLLSDVLNLRFLGFSYVVVFASAAVTNYLYQRFLPHKKWVLGVSSLIGYVLSVQLGLLAATYVL